MSAEHSEKFLKATELKSIYVNLIEKQIHATEALVQNPKSILDFLYAYSNSNQSDFPVRKLLLPNRYR